MLPQQGQVWKVCKAFHLPSARLPAFRSVSCFMTSLSVIHNIAIVNQKGRLQYCTLTHGRHPCGRHPWESICFKNGIKSKNDTIFNISLRKSISSKQVAVTYCSVGSAVSLPSSTCVVQRRLHCDVTWWGQSQHSVFVREDRGRARGCWCEGTQCCDVRGAGSAH